MGAAYVDVSYNPARNTSWPIAQITEMCESESERERAQTGRGSGSGSDNEKRKRKQERDYNEREG